MDNEFIIDINSEAEGRIFEGIGANNSGAASRLLVDYSEPQKSEILDYLFKPNYGAAFQHLKIEVGGDGNSTLGSEPSHARTWDELEHPKPEYFNRGYEWWLAKEAKKRNPNIILDCLPWSAPGWVEPFTRANAEYMISFMKGAKKYHNLDLDYVGLWNEFRYEIEYIKLLRRMLDENGLSNVRIVAADEYTLERENGEIYDGWTIAKDVLKDPEFANAVGALGVHYAGYLEHPMGQETYDTTDAAKSTGKPLWSTEVGVNKLWSLIPEHAAKQNLEYNHLFTNRVGWLGLQEHAKMFNRCYITGKVTKNELWCPVSAYYQNVYLPYSYGAMEAREPWSGNYKVLPIIWATAHTTQFAQPGWKYLDSGCVYLPKGGSCVVLKNPDNEDYSIVIETFGAVSFQTVNFQLHDELSKTPLKVWKSASDVHIFEKETAEINTSDGSFSITLPPNTLYTLTTTTGQQKGHTEPPPSRPFPFPYTDTFQEYLAGRTPKYLSDMEGAFEIVEHSDAGEKSLMQVVEEPVLSWGGAHSKAAPYALIGSNEWTDYLVSADVFVAGAGYAAICGRHQPAPEAGYALKLHHDKCWELTVNDSILASGKIAETDRQWHNLKLVLIGVALSAYIDDVQVTDDGLKDSSYSSGMVGLQASWKRAKFKNLKIEEAR